ncbi:MAG TPA: PilZ domain-containing protein [Acidobacteriaceae bacterium]|nr:PilZ domain-containing protein [Acidobacteriaceae bacterium]
MNTMKSAKGWFAKLFSENRRMAERQEVPRLVAYYWDGGTPMERAIRDISSGGLYLYTEERWYPNTVIMMTVQRSDKVEGDADRSIAVQARVIRSGKDGVAFKFIFPRTQDSVGAQSFPANAADKKAFGKFLHRLREDTGHAVMEYVLLLPVLLVPIVNVLALSGLFLVWMVLSRRARTGAGTEQETNGARSGR